MVDRTLQEILLVPSMDFGILPLPQLPSSVLCVAGRRWQWTPSLDGLGVPLKPPQDLKYRDRGRAMKILTALLFTGLAAATQQSSRSAHWVSMLPAVRGQGKYGCVWVSDVLQ